MKKKGNPNMKKFKTIDDLHAAIEKATRKTIKYYYTDWKNYDRPALMKATGTRETVYIIVRESGSYLYTYKELENGYQFGLDVMDYYTNDRTAVYYKADLDKLTLEKIPAGIPEEIRNRRKEYFDNYYPIAV